MITQCPAIKVQDFNYINNFALIIKILPNSYQIISDEPVIYSEKDLIPEITINNEPVKNLSDYVDTDELIDKYTTTITELKTNIDNDLKNIFDIIKDPTNIDDVDCPDPEKPETNKTVETANIKIYDLQGNLIKNLIDDIPETSIVDCEDEKGISLVNLFEFPDNIDLIKYQESDEVVNICNLPDSTLKKQVKYVIDEIPKKIEEFNDDIKYETLTEKLENIFPNITGVEIKNENDLASYYNNLKNQYKTDDTNKIIAELGIPLCTLENKTPIILQIINKKIQVMNLFDGTSGKMLEIDKEIDLYKQLTIIFKTNGFLHELYLIIEDDSTIYYSKVFTPKNLSIYYIGIDPKAIKNYCGLIFDIQILTYVNNPVETYLENNYLFQVPQGCLAFYDWHKDRIKRNLVYPLPDYRFPVKMYGDNGTLYKIHTEKNPYHFMEMSYLSEFFCSKLLNQDEWSFWFWFYVGDNMPYYNDVGFSDFRALIYDFINKNSLEYDFGTKTFKINFGGEKFYKHYMFALNTWYFIVFKYKKSENLIRLEIRKIDIEDPDLPTIFEVNVSNEISFVLTSMLASFDGWKYDQFFACKFGTLAIFDRFTTSAEEASNFLQNRMIIKTLEL
jgi:hypothetical protein